MRTSRTSPKRTPQAGATVERHIDRASPVEEGHTCSSRMLMTSQLTKSTRILQTLQLGSKAMMAEAAHNFLQSLKSETCENFSGEHMPCKA